MADASLDVIFTARRVPFMHEKYGTPGFWKAYAAFVSESLTRHRHAIDCMPGGRSREPV